MENRMAAWRFFASLRMTATELVILSEAKNLNTTATHYIGIDSRQKSDIATFHIIW